MRTSWIKELIKNKGISDDDFRREVDENLNMNLFPELMGLPLSPVEPVQVNQQITTDHGGSLSKHQSTPISVGIDKFIDEKTKLTRKSEWEQRNSLGMLIADFGDIPLGKLTRESRPR